MSSMLYVLARWATKARSLVIIGWVAILVMLGFGAFSLNQGLDNSVTIPGTESVDALARLNATFPQVSGASAQLLVVGPDSSNDIADGPATQIINDATDKLADLNEVAAVTGLNNALMPANVSTDGTTALITIQLDGAEMDISAATKTALTDSAKELNETLPDGYSAHIGGQLFSAEFPTITVTEALGVLIAIVVMFFTLGTMIAAGLPLVTALVGVGASTMLIFMATSVASVNSTTPLLAVMLGLAVGIDYSLFIVSRHRDQLIRGMNITESIAQAIGTAGSAVVFAGLTVMIALLGLSVAGIPFLTTMGVAGAVAVGLAVTVALTFLPALLSFVGLRVLSKKERKLRGTSADNAAPEQQKTNRFFSGWVTTATKAPLVTIIVVVVALGALAVPALQLRLALPDAGVLPKDNDARTTYDLIAEKYGEGFNGPLIVTAPIVTSTDPLGLMDDLKGALENLQGIADIPLATPNETADTGIIQVVPRGAPNSVETEQLVRDIRAMRADLQDKYGVEISVTGMTAVGIDISAKLTNALFPFALVVVGLSLVLLTIVFRSIAVPVTAALGYLLSVVAAFGVVTLVFENGFMANVFAVTRLGPIINFMPIIVMGILFGLSMDYEVFLVSRMREDYVHTGKARQSIITGFMGSAKVVTAAAIIMVSVFAAFVPEGDMSIKPIALGLAVGVAIDAFLIRMTLIPAIMMWLGDKAWWIPRWLDNLLPTFDVEGEGIVRQRTLKDWPGKATLIAAKDLQVGSLQTQTQSSSINLLLPEEESLLVEGESPQLVQELVLTMAGRQEPRSGDLKVLNYLLPERASAVRRRVAYVSVTDSEDLDLQIKRAVNERPQAISAYLGAESAQAELFSQVPSEIKIILGTVKTIEVPQRNNRQWSKFRLTSAIDPQPFAQRSKQEVSTGPETPQAKGVRA